MKPLNNGHLRVLNNYSVIERCPLLGGNLKKIVGFGTKRFVRYSWHVRYLGCPLLRGLTVLTILTILAASDLFRMFAQSIKLYTFHYNGLLRVQTSEKCDSSNRH